MRWLAVLPILLLLSCSDMDDPGEISNKGIDPGNVQADWLSELIASLEGQPVRNPPAVIARYNYKDEVVYYVPPYCCDEMSVLYNSDGEIICHPGGGIAGQGDGLCDDFFELRSDEEIIWRDSRTR